MKLSFIGADHEVTGSCHFVEVGGTNILLDCGMEQGRDIYENQSIPVKSSDIDFVILSHAHIDHSGLLPLLYKEGFKGQIYATRATSDLCDIMLRDSAHIQEFEAEWRNRKGKRAGATKYEPIYDMNDAKGAIELFVPCPYGEIIDLNEHVSVRFTDVGHLLGSACVELWLREDGVEKKLAFSGDIGNYDQPIIRDPGRIADADYVLVESTYGNRSHGERPDYVKAFTDVLQETFDRGGNVVVPSFAVGRTQEILYFVREIKEKGLITGHDGFEVYVDSPLAIDATTVFDKHAEDCYDDDALELHRKGVRPFIFDGLKTTTTSDESKMINFNKEPKLILSASGMCEAGRIRHHLKHNLWREECTVLFVGYQAEGTLGRKLIDGAHEVTLFGENIAVNARIETLAGISGHADENGLLDWLKGFETKPEKVFVVHGEDAVTEQFADTITKMLDIPAFAPYSGGSVDLATGEIISLGTPVPIVRDEDGRRKSEATRKAEGIFGELEVAGRRLADVIARNEGGANKDLTKFKEEILALCEKWDREQENK